MAEITVVDIMRTQFPTIQPLESVAAVAAKLAESGLPGIPVVDGEDLVGIVTESDLLGRNAEVDVPAPGGFLDAIVTFDVGRKLSDELRRVLGTTAAEIMTTPVTSVRSVATLNELATLMVTRHLNPVPVIDDAGRLIGMVTRADVVRLLARLESE